MKFIKIGSMDFQKEIAQKSNTSLGNFVILTTKMQPFEFDSFLQDEDFYLQKVSYISGSDEEQFQNYLLLDDTYKNTGYFESYEFASEIDVGCYRIIAGEYYSASLVKAIDLEAGEVISTGFNLIDDSGNTLIDDSGNTLTQPI